MTRKYTRRKKQSKGGNIAIIFVSLIIVSILLFIFVNKLQNLDNPDQNNKENQAQKYDDSDYSDNNIDYSIEILDNKEDFDNDWKINDELSIKWTIINFPYDTKLKANYKIIYNNEEIILKSSSIDLDDFKDKTVSLNWHIIEFINNKAILMIKWIEETSDEVVVDENIDEENIDEWNIKKTIYSGQWININVSNWANLEIDSSNGNIKIMSGSVLTGNTIVNITPFKCSPEDYAKDCNSLKKYFKDFKFKYTTNNNNIKLWHMSEEKQRMAFSGVFWYKFKPTNNEEFLKITNSFSFEDTSAMMNNMILSTCNDISSQIKLIEIISSNTDAGNNLIVKGKDNKANDIVCKLSVNYENGILVWKLIEITYEIGGEGTVVSNENKESVAIIEKETTSNNEETETWLNKSDYLTYKSNGFGFEVWMPKNSKFEAPAVIEQPFAVAGLDCKQVVKIARWRDGDLNNPDVKVYYCETNVWINTITEVIWDSYKIVEKKDNIFIIEYADGFKATADGLVLY